MLNSVSSRKPNIEKDTTRVHKMRKTWSLGHIKHNSLKNRMDGKSQWQKRYKSSKIFSEWTLQNALRTEAGRNP